MDTEETRTARPVDASAVAAGLGVPLPCLWERLGSSVQTMPPDLASAAFQRALGPTSRALEILDGFFHDSVAVRVWLRTPHPDLGGCTALETILDGHAQAVCIILENALSGIPV